MKNTRIGIIGLGLSLSILASQVMAASIYDGRNLNDHATLGELGVETTRLNDFTYGNALGIQFLSTDQVRQDNEFKADQQRQDAFVTKDQARQDARADDQDLALIGQNQRNDVQDTRLNGHDQQFATQDQINSALSTKLNGMYTDTAGLSRDMRQVRREAKQANAGASNAMAVAGMQMCTLRECGGQLAVAASTMNGYQAVAVGFGAAVSENLFLNAAFSTSSNVTGAVVAGTYSFR